MVPFVTLQIGLCEFRLVYETYHERYVRKATYSIFAYAYPRAMHCVIIIIIIIIITDLYSAFRSEDTEALDAAQED